MLLSFTLRRQLPRCGLHRGESQLLVMSPCGAARTLAIDLDPMRDQRAVDAQIAMTLAAVLFGKMPFSHDSLEIADEIIREGRADFSEFVYSFAPPSSSHNFSDVEPSATNRRTFATGLRVVAEKRLPSADALANLRRRDDSGIAQIASSAGRIRVRSSRNPGS